MHKLLIIEPWEFGTLNGVGPLNVVIKKATKDNWLIVFEHTIDYKGHHTKYLLSKAHKKHINIDLSERSFEPVVLGIAIIPGLNETNFMDYDLENHRGQFLTGELSQ